MIKKRETSTSFYVVLRIFLWVFLTFIFYKEVKKTEKVCLFLINTLLEYEAEANILQTPSRQTA